MFSTTDNEERIFARVLRKAERITADQREERAFQDRVAILKGLTGLPDHRLATMLREAEAAETHARDRFFSVPFQLLLAGGFLAAA
ncbi:MAG: hypothetical protein LJE65_05070, partial [Desulfobacteraceae bacterium]|nr:hypothetical protein [Desulfobacteraceae bacterium]